MASKIYSAANLGLESHLIEVEADITNSNPNFLIVGLPDAAVQEAKERVKSAIKNSDLIFPRTKVTVNLAPGDLKKAGPAFDLPIAVAVVMAKKQLKLTEEIEQSLFVGELGLNGELRPITGVLAIASALSRWQIKNLFLPSANAAEAALIKGFNIYPLNNLTELVLHLKNKKRLAVFNELPKKTDSTFDYSDCSLISIKGQAQAKRALEIAASGYHNLLMVGPPGSGKSLLAKALAEILPPLSSAESLEVTKIYSLSGLLPPDKPLITKRPFRSPHHSASGAALIGGGSFPKPGEITLAHRGILFLDELTEFPQKVLENLRQPMEEGTVTIARATSRLSYPSRFTLVAAANPCPCGYLNDPGHDCGCSPMQVKIYQKKISGPILDRIDLHLEVPRLPTTELISQNNQTDINKIIERITRAHEIQKIRLQAYNLSFNSEINFKQIEKLCLLEIGAKELLNKATDQLKLSGRGYHKIIKIARTIADLEAKEIIQTRHVAEALQFRQQVFRN